MKKLAPACDVVRVNSPPDLKLRDPMGNRTRHKPAANHAMLWRRFRTSVRSQNQAEIGRTHIRAFSRESAKSPSVTPMGSAAVPLSDSEFLPRSEEHTSELQSHS